MVVQIINKIFAKDGLKRTKKKWRVRIKNMEKAVVVLFTAFGHFFLHFIGYSRYKITPFYRIEII